MTEQRTQPPSGGPAPSSRAVDDATGYGRPPGASGGWVRFGGVLMVVVGAFAVVEGLFALFMPTAYVTTSQTVVTLTFTGWGWLHVISGALVVLVGAALLRDDVPGWARITAIVLVMINLIAQFTWLPAAPVWSILMIVLDVVIIGALVALPDRPTRSA